MIYEEFDLKDRVKEIKKSARVRVFCPKNYDEYSKDVKRKTVIVIPGGGYEWCSHRENEPLAFELLAHDMNAFTIEYSVKEDIEFPYPMIQVFALIAYVRENAEKYNVDPNEIYVLGFSAGGHLAASVACYHQDPQFAKYLGVTNEKIKVNGCLLGYPVILMNKDETHYGSMYWISEKEKPELLDFFDIVKHITKDFPRTYIYETSCDTCVPPVNSYKLKEALDASGIPCVLDLYKWGVHGSSVARRNVYYGESQEYIDTIKANARWIDNMANFINQNEDY